MNNLPLTPEAKKLRSLSLLLRDHEESYFIIDKDYAIIFLNKTAEQRTYVLSKVHLATGDKIYSCVSGKWKAQMIQYIENAFTGKSSSLEKCVFEDGSRIPLWLSISIFPLIDNERIDSVGMRVKDVTVAKQQLRLEKEQKQLKQILINKEIEKKKEILSSVIQSQEKERREISYELHENVAQILATANVLFPLIFVDADSEFNNNPKRIITKAIADLKNISIQLNPFPHSVISLQEAIQINLDLIAASELDIDLVITGSETGLDHLKTCIVRLVQEGVQNIKLHSCATRARICIDLYEMITIIIEDNGRGFDTEANTGGFGLKSMRYRTEFVKGSMQVQSSSDGTKLTFSIPSGTE